MARKPADAKFIADQEERAAKAAAKRANHEQDAMEWERLGLEKRGVSLKQYQKIQDYRRKTAADEERITNENKEQAKHGKRTRDLARDHGKYLKSNSGQLLSSLGIMDESNVLSKKAKDAEIEANKMRGKGKGVLEKRFRSEQQGWNMAAQARKEAMAEIEMGTFDEISFGDNLASELDQIPGMTKKARNEILQEGLQWAKDTNEVIESAGGGEDFAKKMEISKESLSAIDGFEEKVFKIKSFITDPQFRGVLMKAFFIGLAVKAATALVGAIGDLWDTFREFGVSWNSLPLAAGLAKEEAKALLDEFGTLEGTSSRTLLSMKAMSYFTGAQVEDMAKIMKLQMSITNLTQEQALGQQAKWIKDIKKEGVSTNKVFADMAGNADYFANFMKEGGENIKEAAIQASKMGLSLSETASMAESLLDFETSIEKEMEASAILGRQINLDRARQLAFEGKHVEMMDEAKRQAGGEAEFLKMNVVQREALGEAIGLQGQALSKFISQNEEAAEASSKVRWMWIAMGAAVGGVVGLMAGMIPALIGSIPGAQKIGFKQAAKGLAVGIGTGLAGAAAGATLGYATQGAANKIKGMERGGPVRAGNPYIVGEKRPELFVPSVSGNILPNVPRMAEGTGFIQGDMSQTNAKLDKLVGLMSARNEQAETQTRRNIRATEGAFTQR